MPWNPSGRRTAAEIISITGKKLLKGFSVTRMLFWKMRIPPLVKWRMPQMLQERRLPSQKQQAGMPYPINSEDSFLFHTGSLWLWLIKSSIPCYRRERRGRKREKSYPFWQDAFRKTRWKRGRKLTLPFWRKWRFYQKSKSSF